MAYRWLTYRLVLQSFLAQSGCAAREKQLCLSLAQALPFYSVIQRACHRTICSKAPQLPAFCQVFMRDTNKIRSFPSTHRGYSDKQCCKYDFMAATTWGDVFWPLCRKCTCQLKSRPDTDSVSKAAVRNFYPRGERVMFCYPNLQLPANNNEGAGHRKQRWKRSHEADAKMSMKQECWVVDTQGK